MSILATSKRRLKWIKVPECVLHCQVSSLWQNNSLIWNMVWNSICWNLFKFVEWFCMHRKRRKVFGWTNDPCDNEAIFADLPVRSVTFEGRGLSVHWFLGKWWVYILFFGWEFTWKARHAAHALCYWYLSFFVAKKNTPTDGCILHFFEQHSFSAGQNVGLKCKFQAWLPSWIDRRRSCST